MDQMDQRRVDAIGIILLSPVFYAIVVMILCL
jgi:cbb3-type cytochrome oxidase subunit 3